jgi:hypothetical protein
MPDQQYLAALTQFFNDVRTRAADGITLSDLTKDCVDGMKLAMLMLDNVNTMTGPEKLAEVLKVVAYMFDQYADVVVPLPLKPLWWCVRPTARTIVLAMASGVVTSILPDVRKAA